MRAGVASLFLAIVAATWAAGVRRQASGGSVAQAASAGDSSCPAGFAFAGGRCADINECLSRVVMARARCDPNAKCTNTQGSYTCACLAGFVGDGVNCTSSDCVFQGVPIYPNEARVFGCSKCRCINDRRLCTKIVDCTPSESLPPSPMAAVQSKSQYLYVWYSDHDGKDPDFLAALDFDRDSPNYGKVLGVEPLPEDIGHNNEAHHMGLGGDNKTMIAGGFFAYMHDHPDFFLFDISENPERPKYLRGVDAPESTATDDFVRLPNGHLLVSMMGGPDGGPYGRIAEIDMNNDVIAEWPRDPPEDLTPHGISARPDANIMITSDYLLPSSLFGGPIVSRRSMRVWDLEKREIVRTIKIPDSESMMDIVLIPHDPLDRGYAPGQGGKLYLLNTRDGTYEPVFDFNPILSRNGPQNTTIKPVTQPHILRMRADGKRGFMTMYEASKVAMLDTSDPRAPKLLRVIDLGPGAGPHYLVITNDQKRMIVTDCFLLNTYLGGPLDFDGDRLTHVFLLDEDDFYYDPLWYHNGNYFTTGPARPHAAIAVGT